MALIGCENAGFNGSLDIEETLPANDTSFDANSPFWTITRNGQVFDRTPYVCEGENALSLCNLPEGDYCADFEATALPSNTLVTRQCCFTVGIEGCPDEPLEVGENINLSVSTQTGVSHQWELNSNPITSVQSNQLNTSVPTTAGTYTYTAISCFESTLVSSVIDLNAHGAQEGFSCPTGSDVYIVTNLNDSGAGSLRQGLESPQPLTIISNVGGEITLQSPLRPTSCKSFFGGTAPAQGISVRNQGNGVNTIVFPTGTTDVYMEHITIAGGIIRDPLAFYGGQRIAMNHVSIYGGSDEQIDAFFNQTSDIAVYNSIVSLSLPDQGGGGTKGTLFQSSDGTNIGGSQRLTVARNLFAHHSIRSPRVQDFDLFDIRENWIYNFGNWATEIGATTGFPIQGNIVNNYYVNGPNTPPLPGIGGNIYLDNIQAPFPTPANAIYNLYISGNEDVRTPGQHTQVEGRTFVDGTVTYNPQTTPYDCPWPDELIPATSLPATLSPIVGHSLPARGTTDQSIINDALNGTGSIISTQAEFNARYVARPTATGSQTIDVNAVDGVPASYKQCSGVTGDTAQLNQTNSNDIINPDGSSLFQQWISSGQPTDCSGNISAIECFEYDCTVVVEDITGGGGGDCLKVTLQYNPDGSITVNNPNTTSVTISPVGGSTIIGTTTIPANGSITLQSNEYTFDENSNFCIVTVCS